eukprot:gnl/TRDRNA2_/TRDRNA2_41048_c0_seq1.p1 gnl/TRDRNA2_/TRDRNA2_41048_c0~~gnl/TRDRNA2_/TRDRNA2_41048_c0_seq1.p1  ORF type:complete len:414 (-),score=90.92 gnl/TRDRNA2_/TRDRNA2_41048_c0_seq1:88-1329(-)
MESSSSDWSPPQPGVVNVAPSSTTAAHHQAEPSSTAPEFESWDNAMDRIEGFFKIEGTMEKLNAQLRLTSTEQPGIVPTRSQVTRTSRAATAASGRTEQHMAGEVDVYDDLEEECARHNVGSSSNTCQRKGGGAQIPRPTVPKERRISSAQQDTPSLDVSPEVSREEKQPSPPREDTSSSEAPRRFRLGIPRSDRGDDRRDSDMRYLQIPEADRKQFQQYAKALAEKMSVECADSNPYIQALCAHRAELLKGVVDLEDEVVDSLPSRLATQRYDALATLNTAEVRSAADIGGSVVACRPEHCSTGGPGKEEWEAHSSSSTATTAASSRSEAKALKILSERPAPQYELAFTGEARHAHLLIKVGKKHMELSEADVSGFLQELLDEQQDEVHPHEEPALLHQEEATMPPVFDHIP